MKLLISILLSIGVIGCTSNVRENNLSQLDKASIQRIDTLFSEFNNLNSPGFAIGILKDSTVLYKKGYGAANLDYAIPIKSNSAFDIASVSKQFTAACIALLIMEGKLKLEAQAEDYIPELSKYEDTILIKHLVYNTSGLIDYFKLPRNNGGSWLDFNYFDTQEAINTTLQQDTLAFKPGEKWDYSNVNFMLLTKVVEKISGMSFKEFANQRLFIPLGMKNTVVNDDITAVIKNRVTPYNPRKAIYIEAYKKEGIKIGKKGKWIQHHRNAPHYGGSGIISTVDDLLIWEKNFFSHKFGGIEFYSLMHQTMKFNHERANQAFGLYFGTYKDRTFVAWEGANYGISSQVIRFPDQKTAIIVLSNLGSASARIKANEIADILIDASQL